MDKLGVYIPTRNRRDELRACLAHFLPQLKKHSLPVYVFDGGSTDGTEAMIISLRADYKKIFYKRVDAKYSSTYALALASLLDEINTEYVWIFGDDDIVKPGAVDAILRNLDSRDFLQINSEIWSHDFSKMLLKRKIDAAGDVDYAKGEHERVLSAAQGGYAGFMASVVIRSDILKNELKRFKSRNLAGEDYLHMILFYRGIVGRRGKLLADPLIRYRSTARLTGNEFELWMARFPAALERLRPQYSESAVGLAGSLPLYSMIGITCINRIQNPEKVVTYNNLIRGSKALTPPKKALLRFLLLLPVPLTKLAVYPYMRVIGLSMAKRS